MKKERLHDSIIILNLNRINYIQKNKQRKELTLVVYHFGRC